MRTLIALSLSLLLPAAALAADGPEILAKVDKAIGNFADSTIQFQVANLRPGTKEPQPMTFKAVVKGAKNYTEFLSPGDLAGTRVLATSATQMWIFLPEFNKVRKVASHTLSQGFMGTTLTQQDVGTTSYGNEYTATKLSEDDSTWTISLDAKDPSSVGYAHLRMVVDKKMSVPLKVEYLGDDGAVVRTQTRTDYVCPKPDYCMFGQMKMVDHTRGDAWTTLTPTEIKIDTGVSDEIFTQRTLQLGM
ncbi:MAG: outer membrane lipoprotein-sorting protein [Alphaproteobacteria bacterium]|nr:outer membrane lipoprotein-sorting protein [Alphaproteobacteria bacterium]